MRKLYAFFWVICFLLIAVRAYPSQHNFFYSQNQTPAEAAAGFSDPSDISGLVLWLDADQIVGLSDGDNVPTWNDSSGSGRDWAQASAAIQPTYNASAINGNPAVHFASGDLLEHAGHFDSAMNPATMDMFFVFVNKQSGSSPTKIFNVYDNDGDVGFIDQGYFIGVNNFSNGRIYANMAHYNVNEEQTLISGSTDTTYLVHLRGGSSLKDYSVDGTSYFSSSSNDFYPLTDSGASTPFIGNAEILVAEIIIYNKTLDATELANIESYLGAKYNIPVTVYYDGDGADILGSTGANWVGNYAPSINNTLVFDSQWRHCRSPDL